MNKSEFMAALTQKLSQLPAAERQTILDYYDELIADGLENGKKEEEIIQGFDSVDEILQHALEQQVFAPALPGAAVSYRVLKIVLFCFFSPVIFALFLSAYAVLVSFFAAAFSMGIGGAVYTIISFYVMTKGLLVGLFQLGAMLVLLSLGALLGYGTIRLWNLSNRFSRYFFRRIKRLFTNGGNGIEA